MRANYLANVNGDSVKNGISHFEDFHHCFEFLLMFVALILAIFKVKYSQKNPKPNFVFIRITLYFSIEYNTIILWLLRLRTWSQSSCVISNKDSLMLVRYLWPLKLSGLRQAWQMTNLEPDKSRSCMTLMQWNGSNVLFDGKLVCSSEVQSIARKWPSN